MARSYNAEDYQMFLDLLRTGESGEEINNWIHNADPNMWCRSLFPIPRFGITTSNPVEILFSALRNCRHYPALDLLLHLETYILSKRFEKWNKYQQMKNVINDSTVAKIDQQSAKAVYYHVQQTGLSTAVILTTGTSKRYAVDISKKECSCGFYQEELIPCSHAIKFLTSIGRDPKNYCSGIHTVEYLRQMYAEGDDPVHATVINDLCINPLAPPVVETLRGRKKKNRIESQSIAAPKVRKTRTVICPLCNTQGHTRRTCRKCFYCFQCWSC
jgi:hypothetical protein